jgi:RNA polymerase sigma-70 factor (ECF subfamily)
VERLGARATYQLGMCYLKKDQNEKAAQYFQQAVDYYPEQTSVVEQARTQLSKIKPASNQDVQAQVISYLGEQHLRAYKDAKKAGIRSNSLAYYVDASYVKIQGGLLTFENNSGEVINSEISLGNFSKKNITECYNEKFEPQQIRFEDTGRSMGRYALKWTPDEVINPGEIQTLIYKTSEEVLPKTNNGCRLNMMNHFGSEVLENFFLILPTNMNITDGLDNLTSHERIDKYDIYLWQKRVPQNTTNSKLIDIEILKEYPDAAKPVVTDSFPETYSTDVDPAIDEISVTFDQDMFQYGWAWCQIAGPEVYPQVVGQSHYINLKTCVLPVKIEPAKSYLVLINSGPYRSFRSSVDIPAREYAIVFATKDINGNPTEIRPDLLQKAEQINAINAVPEPVLDVVPASVRAYIADKFYETHDKAQAKGLRTNSHVHIIDQDFNRNFGAVQIFKNTTGQVIDHEISRGSNDSPEMIVYDEKGVRQKIRTYKKPGSNYRYFWTPSEPIEPDEERMLFYSAGTNKLSVDRNGECSLKMQNHYGSPVIEDFYLVLPSNIELAYQSESFTSHETIEGFNIYCWSKEQGANVKHRVDIKMAKGD